MKLFTKSLLILAQAVLFLCIVAYGGFSGCVAGSHAGRALDVKNGTFGKGIEGSSNEFIYMAAGWIGGMLAGIVACVALYLVIKRLSRRSGI